MWDVQTGVKPIETCFNIQYEKMYSSEKINLSEYYILTGIILGRQQDLVKLHVILIT